MEYTHENCEDINHNLKDKFFDYHLLVCQSNVEGVEFECYNTTDLDTKSFEELKEIVLNLKNQN